MALEVLGRADEFPDLPLPLYQELVSCGFPSPASGYEDEALDLNRLCIRHPAATYFVRAGGVSMIGAGIYPDDILVVDRSKTARDKHIVVAALNGEFTVKRLQTEPVRKLVAENDDYPDIELTEDDDLQIFGVVTFCIHKFCV